MMPCASSQSVPDLLKNSFCKTLNRGDVIKVKDLEIAKNPNIDLKTDPEAVVVSCTAVHNSVPEQETAEEAE